MERFIEFGEGKAQMVNNADWLLNLNYVDLLRDVGACFSVNNMLRAECYKQRMEKGLALIISRISSSLVTWAINPRAASSSYSFMMMAPFQIIMGSFVSGIISASL